MKAVLFLGRFQPFHNGHLKVLEELAEKYDKVVIAIGSRQHSRTKENPFSFEERRRVIEQIVKNRGIKNAEITGIDDINRNEEYVAHVEKHARFDAVATGNELVKKLFREKGYRIIELPRYYELHAENLRKKVMEGNDFSEDVPEEVAEFLKEKGAEIIRRTNSG
ncbi:nicotinamide-nucleotide adenylyltransferase [Candidatus Woesearchaeota archaeon]|nr:MAG: nicotinamide-nucleotide adenylyltransferase [Candidatus Woesearchaeota archaeon]